MTWDWQKNLTWCRKCRKCQNPRVRHDFWQIPFTNRNYFLDAGQIMANTSLCKGKWRVFAEVSMDSQSYFFVQFDMCRTNFKMSKKKKTFFRFRHFHVSRLSSRRQFWMASKIVSLHPEKRFSNAQPHFDVFWKKNCLMSAQLVLAIFFASLNFTTNCRWKNQSRRKRKKSSGSHPKQLK